jgi:hypothetical protein
MTHAKGNLITKIGFNFPKPFDQSFRGDAAMRRGWDMNSLEVPCDESGQGARSNMIGILDDFPCC